MATPKVVSSPVAAEQPGMTPLSPVLVTSADALHSSDDAASSRHTTNMSWLHKHPLQYNTVLTDSIRIDNDRTEICARIVMQRQGYNELKVNLNSNVI